MIFPKAILSTAYLGNIYYYMILANAVEITIEQHEHYLKQSYRNRCSIYGANGKLDLTIPIVKNPGSKTGIKEVEICYKQNWTKTHWQSIISAYNSSPFFEYYRDYFETLYNTKPHNLFQFNLDIQNLCLKLLKLSPAIKLSNEFIQIDSSNEYSDLRYVISPKKDIESSFFKKYYQVFSDKHGFIHNLSILDLLFNEGTNSAMILKH